MALRRPVLVAHGSLLMGMLLAPHAAAAPDPVVSVAPETLAVTLAHGQATTRTVLVSNERGADLSWNVDFSCGLPPQWIRVQPFSGTVPANHSQELSVTFDASVLLTGTYTPTLCLATNDPAHPLVTVPLTLTVVAAQGAHILFDQTLGIITGAEGPPVQRLVPPGALDTEAAEDFFVADAEGWTIGQLNLRVSVNEPPTLNLRVYPDDQGQPGEAAICSHDAIPSVVHGIGQLRVPLPEPCVLAPGRYWIVVQRSEGSLRWGTGVLFPLPGGFGRGANGHWSNPGDGFRTGCTTLSDITRCFVPDQEPGEEVPIGGGGDNYLFQICGAVSGHGDAVGCGPENAGAQLVVTLAPDNGDARQCGTATTLDVVTGDAVNVCYSVTNTGDVPLAYNGMDDNLNARPLFYGQPFSAPLLPGERFQLNRLIHATRSQVVTAEAQGVDVLPWYFPRTQEADFVDISRSGTALDLADDGSANLTMPFRFNVFGLESDQLCINNNGFLLLDWSKPCDGFQQDTAIPNENVPLRSAQIAPLWDDLFTGGNVYYAVIGEPPHRRFIVQWDGKNHYNDGVSDPEAVTFEAILEETTHTLSFQYLNTVFGNPAHPEWDRGRSATIGFQSRSRDGFGSPWLSLPFHQPQLEPQSGLTWRSTGFSHATAPAAAMLNVHAPSISVSPEALAATIPPGGRTSASLTIANRGTFDLRWQTGVSPLGSTSHFVSAPASLSASANEGEGSEEDVDLSGLEAFAPSPKLRTHQPGPPPDLFATRAFALHTGTISGDFRYSRLDDLSHPAATQDIGALPGYTAFAGAFLGKDFSQQFMIDDSGGAVFTLDTATGVASRNLGRVLEAPPLPRIGLWRGITWDATTQTLYGLATDTFDILPDTRFFLARIDRGHDVEAKLVGELPALSEGVAIFAIAVDPIGRLFGVDILGDRLMAIDKDTAVALPIGPLGFDAAFGSGMDFDDGTGTLYLATIDFNTQISNLYTVDPLTGEATVVDRRQQLGNGSQHMALAIASGPPCVPPADVPWLSVTRRTSGSIAPGGSEDATVEMDASGLAVGTYHANVCVGSDDPDRPILAVPVSLMVAVGAPGPTPRPRPRTLPGSELNRR